MILVSFLLAQISSKPIVLTDRNYDEVISNETNVPLFVEIWDKHFFESKIYKETWKSVHHMEDLKPKVDFAELNCHYQSLTCQKISPGRYYPRFVWINRTTKEIKPYTGGSSPEEIREWIESQLNEPIEVMDEAQLNETIPMASKMPLFVFRCYKDDNNGVDMAKEAALEVRHMVIKMVMILDQNNHPPQLTYYATDHRQVSLQDDEGYNVETIIKFIRVHSIKFFAPYSESIAHFSEVEEMPVAVFLYPHEKDVFRNKAIELARKIEHLLPTVQTGCAYSKGFCRYVGVKSDRMGVLVIIDKSKNLFWIHNLDMELPNWTSDVVNGLVTGSGPGTGVLKEYLMLFYDMRMKGGWQYYLIFLPFGVGIFAVFIPIFIIAFSLKPTKNIKVD